MESSFEQSVWELVRAPETSRCSARATEEPQALPPSAPLLPRSPGRETAREAKDEELLPDPAVCRQLLRGDSMIAAMGSVGCGRSRLLSVSVISISCTCRGGSPQRGPSRGCLEAWTFAWKKAQSVVTVRGVQEPGLLEGAGFLP